MASFDPNKPDHYFEMYGIIWKFIILFPSELTVNLMFRFVLSVWRCFPQNYLQKEKKSYYCYWLFLAKMWSMPVCSDKSIHSYFFSLLLHFNLAFSFSCERMQPRFWLSFDFALIVVISQKDFHIETEITIKQIFSRSVYLLAFHNETKLRRNKHVFWTSSRYHNAAPDYNCAAVG